MHKWRNKVYVPQVRCENGKVSMALLGTNEKRDNERIMTHAFEISVNNHGFKLVQIRDP